MPAPPLTTSEYFSKPETLYPQELVYGLVRDAPAPTPGHQWVVGEVFAALRAHLQQHDIGRLWMAPIDVVLDADRHLVVQPDIIVVSNTRLHIVTDCVRGAPDLVIDVLSPRPRIGRLDERLAWFARYGVRECWLVHQSVRQIELLQFVDGGIANRQLLLPDEQIRSVILPQFDRSGASMLEAR